MISQEEYFELEKRYIAQRLLKDGKITVDDLIEYFRFSKEDALDLAATIKPQEKKDNSSIFPFSSNK